MRLGIPLLALGALLGDCCGRDRPVFETTAARCDVGGKPGYFVPASSPPVLIGCARLGASGKRVGFSRSRARIDGKRHVCIDPAYGPRGRFIPGICLRGPSRLLIRDASRPRQGVRGYAFVVWGTAPAATTEVTARVDGATARAAVFRASPKFAVFVLELPMSAACGLITVTAHGGRRRSSRSSASSCTGG